MKIEVYHWNTESGIGSNEMTIANISHGHRQGIVVVSVAQKRYYIPKHLKAFKGSILKILNDTWRLPQMLMTKTFKI